MKYKVLSLYIVVSLWLWFGLPYMLFYLGGIHSAVQIANMLAPIILVWIVLSVWLGIRWIVIKYGLNKPLPKERIDEIRKEQQERLRS